MVSSSNSNDYYYLRDPNGWNVSPTNINHLKRFITHKRGNGVKLNTIDTYIGKLLVWLDEIGVDDALNITTDQILQAYFSRMDKVGRGEYSNASLDGDVIALKQFFQFLLGYKEGRERVSIKRRKTHNTYLSTAYVTPEQIKSMRNYAESTGDIRGVALLMLTFGTGARLSEILDANVGDLTIKQCNAVLRVDGKTGKRSIPFVIGMPEIIAWINAHPVKGADGKADPSAPLFVTYNTRGHGNVRISKTRAEMYFSNCADKAGIPRNTKSNPHAFRHVMATIMARQMTIKEMNLFFGWSPQSTTALTYIHTSQDDLEQNVLAINGVSVPDEEKRDEAFVMQCPSCNKILSAGTRICPQCRMILDPMVAVQFDRLTSDMVRQAVLKSYLDGVE